MKEIRVHATLKGQETSVNEAGEFEIVAITAGLGNGWEFPAAALQESLSLWEGAECFVDHSWWGGRSVRDLAGVLQDIQWDGERQGIKARLSAVGEAGSLLNELGRKILGMQGRRPKIGFSADLVFTANAKKVEKILRINSVDLVYNPARGGAFVRALNAVEGEDGASRATHPTGAGRGNLLSMGGFFMGEEEHEVTTQVNQDLEAARQLLQVQQEKEKLAAEAEAAKAIRAQMCALLLGSALAASKLPEAAREMVRKQFDGKVFEAEALNAAIESTRELVGQLTAAQVATGPGRISAMFSSEDQLQAAVDDMFEVPRNAGLEGLKTAKLSGIRELYLMLTGDHELHGGYYRNRVQLATTSDFSGLVKNALNKMIANTWENMALAGFDWWKRVVITEHFDSLNTITGILIGTVGDLPAIAEGGEYTELALGDSPETASFQKYGGYVPLTLELIDRDQTRKLKSYARELGNAGIRKISGLVAAIFTANSGVGPTMADGGALFNSTAVTSAGGHANLLTTALSASQWDTVQAAVYNQPSLIKNAVGYYGTGSKMGINPRYTLVPRALELTAKKIRYGAWENTANIHADNMQQGQMGDVVVVPEWTDTNDWAAVVDPRVIPSIFVGERFGLMPQVFVAGDELSPAVFMNDETRLKVRHFLAVWVNDFRPLHKENV